MHVVEVHDLQLLVTIKATPPALSSGMVLPLTRLAGNAMIIQRMVIFMLMAVESDSEVWYWSCEWFVVLTMRTGIDAPLTAREAFMIKVHCSAALSFQ